MDDPTHVHLWYGGGRERNGENSKDRGGRARLGCLSRVLSYATDLTLRYHNKSVASELSGQGGTLYPQVQDLYPLYPQVKDAAYVKILSKRL